VYIQGHYCSIINSYSNGFCTYLHISIQFPSVHLFDTVIEHNESGTDTGHGSILTEYQSRICFYKFRRKNIFVFVFDLKQVRLLIYSTNWYEYLLEYNNRFNIFKEVSKPITVSLSETKPWQAVSTVHHRDF